MNCADVGNLIRKLRTDLNMTQKQPADKLGVSDKAVSKWENGTSDPSTSNLIALAKLFKISAEDLLREVQ